MSAQVRASSAAVDEGGLGTRFFIRQAPLASPADRRVDTSLPPLSVAWRWPPGGFRTVPDHLPRRHHRSIAGGSEADRLLCELPCRVELGARYRLGDHERMWALIAVSACSSRYRAAARSPRRAACTASVAHVSTSSTAAAAMGGTTQAAPPAPSVVEFGAPVVRSAPSRKEEGRDPTVSRTKVAAF